MDVADCWYKYKSADDSPDQIRQDIQRIWWEITQNQAGEFKTRTSSYLSIADPLAYFLHLVWRQGIAFKELGKRTALHVYKEELVFLRAIKQRRPIHPGWLVANFFHVRKKSVMKILPGGAFVARIIETKGLTGWVDVPPALELTTVGYDIIVQHNLDLDTPVQVQVDQIPRGGMAGGRGAGRGRGRGRGRGAPDGSEDDSSPEDSAFEEGMPPPSSSTYNDIRDWQHNFDTGALPWQQQLGAGLDDQDRRMAEYNTRAEERHAEQMRY
ncbi:hypothetical protein LINGRAPRIM_LOCUS2556 [Linum grandiflorum]